MQDTWSGVLRFVGVTLLVVAAFVWALHAVIHYLKELEKHADKPQIEISDENTKRIHPD